MPDIHWVLLGLQIHAAEQRSLPSLSSKPLQVCVLQGVSLALILVTPRLLH